MSQYNKPAPRSLKQWLTGQSGRQQILSKAAELARLGRRLQRALPAAVAGHWQLARLDAQALVLFVDAAAWATQLRYCSQQLLDAAEEAAGVRPQRLEVRVAAQRRQHEERLTPSPAPSAEAAETIRSMARTIDDERLRDALERLAQKRRGG